MRKFSVSIFKILLTITFCWGCVLGNGSNKTNSEIVELNKHFKEVENIIQQTKVVLQDIHQELGEQINEEKFPSTIIVELKGRNFNAAVKLLQKFGNNKDIEYHINYIVEETYGNHAANFDLVATFAESISNCVHQLYVLKAIVYEIEKNSHYRQEILNRLGNVFLKNACKKRKQWTDAYRVILRFTLLIPRMYKPFTKKYLKQILLDVFQLDGDGFILRTVITDVVNNLISEKDIAQIISIFSTNPVRISRILGYEALLEKTNLTGDTKDDFSHIGYSIKRDCNRKNESSELLFKPLEEMICVKLEAFLLDNLSLSSNISSFAKKVCLWNKYHEGFLAGDLVLSSQLYAWLITANTNGTSYSFHCQNENYFIDYSYRAFEYKIVKNFERFWDLRAASEEQNKGCFYISSNNVHLCLSVEANPIAYVSLVARTECLWDIINC